MEFIGRGGVPVGLVPDVTYEQEEFMMEKGDRLLLYSDGFTEAHLKNGAMLDTEGLVELVKRCNPHHSGKAFLDDLYWQLTQVMGDDKGLEDDISATLFEFQGP